MKMFYMIMIVLISIIATYQTMYLFKIREWKSAVAELIVGGLLVCLLFYMLYKVH